MAAPVASPVAAPVLATPGTVRQEAVVPPATAPAAFGAGRVCPGCTKEADDASVFCRFCGTKLPPTAAPVQAAPVPVAVPVPVPVAAPVRTLVGRLIVIAKDGSEGVSHSVYERLDIGRNEGDIRIPDDRFLSPKHARIELREGRPYLVDTSEGNGIYLRLRRSRTGTEAGPVPLADQDLFLVGQQVLRFEAVLGAEDLTPARIGQDTFLFGTPAARRFGRLVQRGVEGTSLDIYNLRRSETVIGRESGDIVFTDDPFLSRRHAAVRIEEGGARVSLWDLGSSNGTFYRLRNDVELRHKDQFRVGQQLFRLELQPAFGGLKE